MRVELSPDGSTFYIQSTEAHPGERHLYAMGVDGGARTKLTSQTGGYDGADVARQHDVRAGLVVREPTARGLPDAESRRRGGDAGDDQHVGGVASSMGRASAGDLQGARRHDVYARLYTPEMVGAKRHPKAPAVVFVHGAGYLQNAHVTGPRITASTCSITCWRRKGYVVLDPDYRASAGYGRDWRTAIYRWMGGKDLEDVVDGAGISSRRRR